MASLGFKAQGAVAKDRTCIDRPCSMHLIAQHGLGLRCVIAHGIAGQTNAGQED